MLLMLNSGGGVEDPTFEAKDSKKFEAKTEAWAKYRIFEDRPSRGQEEECSNPVAYAGF